MEASMTAIRRAVIVLTVALTGSLRGTDWWVDSMGTGDGTDPATPMASVQAAIDAASAGHTINIRGGEGRLYTSSAYLVNKAGLTLRGWEGKPIFRLLGAVDGIDNRVVNIAAGGVVLRDLRFEIQGNVIGSNDDIVEITTASGLAAHNVTLDGCEFTMTAFGGIWNQGSPIMQGVSPYGTNIQVRSCYFANWDYGSGDGYRLNMIVLNGDRCHVVGNTFTNTSKVVTGLMRYSRISNNRILNCRNDRRLPSSITDGGIIRTGYNALRDCEISYNLVWNNNGLHTSFLDKSREGLTGDTRIFNNTLYNTDGLVGCQYYTSSPGTTQWRPLIYNNLLVNSLATNIFGVGTNTLGVLTSTFLPASEIKNNLWYGGANQLVDPPSVGITPVGCYNVSCAFVNTTDTGSPDFLRPDGDATPQVMLGIGGAYPAYIGAVEPKVGNPATVIAVR
jgi:hypothetical protein